MIMPTTTFLIMISGFFIYKSPIFGLMFLVGNIMVGLYATYFWNDMADYKNDQETWINDNEKYLVDILNNIDKVIYRGQVQSEIDAFSQKTDDSIAFANGYYGYVQNHTTIMSGMIYIIIFASIYYLTVLRFQDKITTTIFISFFTVLLLYRDKILGTINNIPDYLEFVGRLGYIVGTFNTMLGQKENVAGYLDKKYDEIATPFDRIQFRDVSFKYDKTEKMILDHLNIDLEFKDKIIGITGLSGKGKSSFVKLMLRLYEPTSGEILLDGIPLKTIDPSFIRKNITYVNQNAKLFDKKVIDNILYGCNELGECREHLDKILKDAKIQELFRNVDLENTKAGSLGENLSGGQRQIINMIGGFINPSEILILDEPTNALDGDLKKQVLQFIQYFKRYKKCVIIITHDRDVFPLFDENVQI
jgi:ABC-type bacteriocin/lantibiotic exporter with double-glycine peptidase domain